MEPHPDTNMTNGQWEALVSQYLAGELDVETAARVRAYLERIPASRGVLAGVADALSGEDALRVSPDFVAARARFLHKVTERDGAFAAPLAPRRRPRRVHRYVTAGAGVAMLVGVVASIQAWRARHIGDRQASQPQAYATARGQHTTVTLPNGSVATLAPETRLTYAQDATGAAVTLQGEAFFSVTPTASRPFVVHAGPVSARVLGTTFTVRRYTTDHTTAVAVVSGRVGVTRRGASAILTAGMQGAIGDSSATVTTISDPADAIAWTEGRLVFHDVPVSVMLETIGRWYGYQFQMDDSALARQHVSVRFRADHPVEAFNKLKAVLDVTMTFDGTVVSLHPSRSAHVAPSRHAGDDSLDQLRTEVGR